MNGKNLYPVHNINHINIYKKDESFLFIESKDEGILYEIYEYYSFYVDGYKYMPKYKSGMWDGKIRLCNLKNNTLPIGLFSSLCKFCEKRGYTYDIGKNISFTYPRKDIESFMNNLSIYEKTPYDYQLDCAKHALREEKVSIISPTGSGKSLIIYMILSYFMENSEENEKALIIVPTTSLVEQLYDDFIDYALDKENMKNSIQKIFSGQTKNIEQKVVISTWQSIYNMPKNWFDSFGMVNVDEVHHAKSTSITKIMSNCSSAFLRIGTTGTLSNDSKVDEMIIEGHFGPPYSVKTTAELIDENILSQFSVLACHCIYEKDESKMVRKMDYQNEISYVIHHELRNNCLVSLASNQKGNTLILFRNIDHGHILHEKIKNSITHENLFYIDGSVETEKREEIRKSIEEKNNAIIVASMGTFSTGINIRNLNNIIFAAPYKSSIKVLQSIGRGLRQSNNGQKTTKLYDLIDDFSGNTKQQNYLLSHGIHRLNLYEKETFSVSIKKIQMRDK